MDQAPASQDGGSGSSSGFSSSISSVDHNCFYLLFFLFTERHECFALLFLYFTERDTLFYYTLLISFLLLISAAEPKTFISGSNFVNIFCSSSSSCHIFPLKTVLEQYLVPTIRKMSQCRFFFILASSKVQTDCSKYVFLLNR